MSEFIVGRFDGSSPDAGAGADLGGKASNLLFLAHHGVPVPDFFCVRSASFASFVAPELARIEAMVAGLRSGAVTDVASVAASVQRLLLARPLDPDLLSDLAARLSTCGDVEFFSVRSSAVGEDSATNSFAGLFETSLFVTREQVPEQLRRCWAAAFNANVLRYCMEKGLDPLRIRMGVVVQRMVAARRSGIMFTANPNGSLVEMVIVACHGVGEGVVAGKVETDTYYIDKGTKEVRSEIAHKRSQVALARSAGAGTELQPVPAELADGSTLEPAELAQLIETGLELERLYGEYQDVEWAIDELGKVHILQARPITTILPGRLSVFDNSNIVESFPGITRPLTFSVVKQGYARNFGCLLASIAPSQRILEDSRTTLEHMIGSIGGRVFYNLSNWYRILSTLPLLRRFAIASFDEMVGIRDPAAAFALPARRKRFSVASIAVILARLLRRFLTLRLDMRVYKRRFNRAYRDFRARNLAALSNHDLIELFNRAQRLFFSIIYVPLLNDFFLMMFVEMTKWVMQKAELADHESLFNALMCGDEALESVLPVRSVVQLAEQVRSDPALRERLEQLVTAHDGTSATQAFLEEPEFREFKAALTFHLESYGDRVPEELKLERETFRTNPRFLVETVLSYVPQTINVAGMRESELRIRRGAERQIAASLRWKPLRRLALAYCIGKSRQLLRHRESARLDRSRMAGCFRALFRQLGRNLANERTLASPEDIFFLTSSELADYVHGSSATRKLSTLVEARKDDARRYDEEDPADRIVCRGTVSENPVVSRALHGAAPLGAQTLRGTSCCPGFVEAEALVLLDPAAAPDVAGKILVAQTTDPGWVFVMIRSAGLVVERGSLLSHTAIIGRELGIPTVVGVRDASKRIATGQRIRLDASAGEITLCAS